MSTQFTYTRLPGNAEPEWVSISVGDHGNLTVGDIRRALLGMDPEALVGWRGPHGDGGAIHAVGATNNHLVFEITPTAIEIA